MCVSRQPSSSDFCFERPRCARLLRGDAIGLAEIHAAREGELAVHHHDLAMIALVDAGESLIERIQRIEGAQRDAGAARRSSRNFASVVSEPDGVVQHVDLHAARRGLLQQLRSACDRSRTASSKMKLSTRT